MGVDPDLGSDVDPDLAPEIQPEPARGQAWLDAQRGFQPEPDLEQNPESGPAPLRGQAWLDAQRGYQPEPLSGQAALDAQRGFHDARGGFGDDKRGFGQTKRRARREPELRSRPEPRWSRNDPERPVGYDPEQWAGFESEPESPDGVQTLPGLETAGSSEVGGVGARNRTRRGGFNDEGRRSGLGSKRRSDRPKKPRPERSPEERAERSAQRRERAAETVAADPTAAAKSIVLRQLTMGARTRAQLRQAMSRKDIPEDVATAVLDRFEEVALVDDKEFSRQWVQSRHLGRGLARRALAYELRQRGVDEEILKDAVEGVTPDDELAAARELVRRKAAGMRDDDPQRRMRRLAGMLARKGYGGGVAMQAIREELADLADLELAEGDDEEL